MSIASITTSIREGTRPYLSGNIDGEITLYVDPVILTGLSVEDLKTITYEVEEALQRIKAKEEEGE